MTEIAELEVIKAISCNLSLGESTLDAYMLPSGEKRLGSGGVGLILGRSDRWLYTRSKRAPKWLEALQARGFQGDLIEVKVIREDKRGTPLAKTISIRDFVKLVTHEAIVGHNKKAIVLIAAFMETGIEKVLDDAFAGRSIEFILEKIVHYTRWTYEELQEVLLYNREEVRALYLWKGWDLSGRNNPNLNMTN